MVMDFGMVFCRFEVGDDLRVLMQFVRNLFFDLRGQRMSRLQRDALWE
jgi:hypothetical protein